MVKKISLAIPNFNRVENILDIVDHHKDTNEIDEIIICDDMSDSSIIKMLKNSLINYPKVKFIENTSNIGAFKNKERAVRNCCNDWVILCDSDNFIDKKYVQTISNLLWNRYTVYCPDAAMPHFDFGILSGVKIDNPCQLVGIIKKRSVKVALNAGNFFFNKMEYLNAAGCAIRELNDDELLADVIVLNYYWLRMGNNMHFVSGLKYLHNYESKDSTWRNNEMKCISSFDNTIEKIKGLCNDRKSIIY